MNIKIKKNLQKVFLTIYRPIIVRREKLKATIMWRKGVKECIKAYKETKGPRFYLWFDSNTMTFFPVTLHERAKHDTISLSRLITMGKLKAKRRPTVNDVKRECFYYTPSRWGAIGCDSDNALRMQKYKKWLSYYMTELSEPMRKLNNHN